MAVIPTIKRYGTWGLYALAAVGALTIGTRFMALRKAAPVPAAVPPPLPQPTSTALVKKAKQIEQPVVSVADAMASYRELYEVEEDDLADDGQMMY